MKRFLEQVAEKSPEERGEALEKSVDMTHDHQALAQVRIPK